MVKKQVKMVGGESAKLINQELLRDKIYLIRGQKVMLDFDLAEIYGYTTSAFNQQIARNIKKFEGEDFMFKLTREDFNFPLLSHNLMSQNVISSWGGTRKLPFAFTEQGIYMLMTVLRGELATKQSRALIRMFKAMKDYILENQEQLACRDSLQFAKGIAIGARELEKVQSEVNKIDSEIIEINKKLGDTVKRSELSPILLDLSKSIKQKEYVFMDGELMKASEVYVDIYAKAQRRIYIIDNYISIKTLRHLCGINFGVEMIIFSDNIGGYLHRNDLEDFKNERSDVKISFIKTGNKIHDRFIVLDYDDENEKIYHAGSSEKDAGKKLTTIICLEDELVKEALHNMVEMLMVNQKLILK